VEEGEKHHDRAAANGEGHAVPEQQEAVPDDAEEGQENIFGGEPATPDLDSFRGRIQLDAVRYGGFWAAAELVGIVQPTLICRSQDELVAAVLAGCQRGAGLD
jgi:hypothetical protein